MNNPLSIKGILFDLDGVLYTGTSPIEGAVDTIKAIRTSGMPCRFVTNTSTLSLATLHKKSMPWALISLQMNSSVRLKLPCFT